MDQEDTKGVALVARQRVLGMWLMVLGLLTALGAMLFWSGLTSVALQFAGGVVMMGGGWWTLTVHPALVIWLPWSDPVVYYDPTAPNPNVVAAEAERARVRAGIWKSMGWRHAMWSWMWSETRWPVMVEIAAVRVNERARTGEPFSEATKEETQWLSQTVTAFILGKKSYECGFEIGDIARELQQESSPSP